MLKMKQNIQMRSFRLAPHQYRLLPHSLPKPNSLNITNGIISAKSVSNYDSPLNSPVTSRRQRPCIMCGSSESNIPSQNKRVCKECDTCFWLWVEHQVVFKFCKGCKNFCVLDEFTDKPDNAKCFRCRERSRDWYFSKKPLSASAATVTPGPISVLPSTAKSSSLNVSSADCDEDNQGDEGTRVNRRRRKRNTTEEEEQETLKVAEQGEEEELERRYGPVKKKINFSPMIASSTARSGVGTTTNKISPAAVTVHNPHDNNKNDEMEEKENNPLSIKGKSDSSWEWDEKINPLFLLASLSTDRL